MYIQQGVYTTHRKTPTKLTLSQYAHIHSRERSRKPESFSMKYVYTAAAWNIQRTVIAVKAKAAAAVVTTAATAVMAIKFALFLLSLWQSTVPYFLEILTYRGVAGASLLLTPFLHWVQNLCLLSPHSILLSFPPLYRCVPETPSLPYYVFSISLSHSHRSLLFVYSSTQLPLTSTACYSQTINHARVSPRLTESRENLY